MAAIIQQEPWRLDPRALGVPWNAAMASNSDGRKLVFVFIADDGAHRVTPPVSRALRMTLEALLAQGHGGTLPRLLIDNIHPRAQWSICSHFTCSNWPSFRYVTQLLPDHDLSVTQILVQVVDGRRRGEPERNPASDRRTADDKHGPERDDGASAHGAADARESDERVRAVANFQALRGGQRGIERLLECLCRRRAHLPARAVCWCTPRGGQVRAFAAEMLSSLTLCRTFFTLTFNVLDYPGIALPVTPVDPVLDARQPEYAFSDGEDRALWEECT